MRPIPVKQLDYDLTPTAGLALVGQYLNTIAPVLTRIDAALPARGGVANSDIVRRKAWLFNWTEVGAEYVGIVNSLIVTCRRHQIDPYGYLVDVLQRVGDHPASRVAELTPRHWKQHFADKPLRSALHTRAVA